MKSNAPAAADDRQSTPTAPLQIVLTHDHPAMAHAARNALNSILGKWAADTDIHRDEWSFSELENPAFRAEALELAACGDILVVAFTGSEDLPASFMAWLNDWLATRTEMDSALLLCMGLSAANLQTTPSAASLTTLARSNGLSCFIASGLLPEPICPVSLNIKSLLARLKTFSCDILPETSGLNE